ncbi:hypothetical protein BELL_0661g00040 [Botrytis elliptica]|uniref:Uncharacterized protein n=1 Tax=Botrytis elliptica TaxID=278938 RepID=A0A4Z1JPK2_9HELO|nr:hypothetical protein BELL_0661g00040 [Botrytis elliptica]
MWDTLRQIVRSTPRDSRHRGRRYEEVGRETVGDSRIAIGETRGGTTERARGEAGRETVGDSRGTIGETRGGTMGETRGGTTGRARREALRPNMEQASRVGHIGQYEYRYRGPAPSNSHTQPISSSDSSWNTLRPRHSLHQVLPTPTPSYSPPPPSYSPPPPSYTPSPTYDTPYEASSHLFEHGRRSSSSRSGSDSLVSRNQHNTAIVSHAVAILRQQTAASRSSGSYPPSYRSAVDTNFGFYTSREALLSPRTSHEGRPRSFRASAGRQSYPYYYRSPERPRTSSSRDSENTIEVIVSVWRVFSSSHEVESETGRDR